MHQRSNNCHAAECQVGCGSRQLQGTPASPSNGQHAGPAWHPLTAACIFPYSQEEDHMEPEPHYEDFRSLRRKIFEWEGK